jgi:4-cresol dehydrogenase (hydroxylating) flavoprotein subunit
MTTTIPSTAPGGDLDSALAAWRRAIEPLNVIIDQAALRAAETATFPTEQKVPAILRPESTEEVSECLQIANVYRTPIYPISTGKNWGYGSRVPVETGCVLLDLSRLDRIVDFDEKLAHVTVEPGVTQRRLYEYLKTQRSRLWMDATGSSPDCSIVGNALERGYGHTPYGDHFAQVCGLKVVLPSGEVIDTGFGRFPNARSARVYRWGVGPYVDGLFAQSNLGIVTQMTLWLMPAPDYFQAFYINIENHGQLADVIDGLRPLRMDGTIKSAVHIGNDYKILSSIQQYPSMERGQKKPLSAEVLNRFAKSWDFGAWNVSGGLYGTRREVALARNRIKEVFRKNAKRLRFVDDHLLRLLQYIQSPYYRFTGLNLPELLKIMQPIHGLKKGIPTDRIIPSTYWRKKDPAPSNPDPDRDRCGLLWCSVISPTNGKDVKTIVDIVYETLTRYGFEPAISIIMITERSLDNVISVMYDRDIPGEDERAVQCHDELLMKLTAEGYYPYRHNIRSMKLVSGSQREYRQFLSTIKRSLDPNNILAPGRYEN